LAGLLEYFAVTSSTFQSQLMMVILDAPTTICTAQLQLCKDFVLTTTSYKDLTPIAVRWNIVQQNQSNRKGTADRARANSAGEATK
jgi:hypothetical protein